MDTSYFIVLHTLVAKGVHLLTCIKVTYQGDDDQGIYAFLFVDVLPLSQC